MTPALIVTVIGLLASWLAQAALLIIWGAKLSQRVLVLEREIKPLKDLPIQIAKIGERQEIWIEQLKDLNSSIRWMRDPAEHAATNPAGRK